MTQLKNSNFCVKYPEVCFLLQSEIASDRLSFLARNGPWVTLLLAFFSKRTKKSVTISILLSIDIIAARVLGRPVPFIPEGVVEEEVVVGVPTTTEVDRLLEGATITTAERGPGMTIMTPGHLSTQEVATMTTHLHRDMDHVSPLFDCGFNFFLFPRNYVLVWLVQWFKTPSVVLSIQIMIPLSLKISVQGLP